MLEELQRRNYAKTTVQYYIQAVERFAKYFRTPPDQLNQSHLRTYQAYLLRERKLAPRTVKLHVSALRFFFVKTLKRRYMLEDIPFPKVPRRLPAILTTDEVTRLIDGARNLTDRTMLMVLYSTGMRNAELRHLQVRDIDSRRLLIHIQHGKGGRDRYVPLSATLLATLRAYYRWMRPKTWLFPGTIQNWRADKPITPKVVWEACRIAATAPSWTNACRLICCGIRTRRTSSKRVPTCAPCSSCSGTSNSNTPSSISTCRSGICRRSPIRLTRCRSPGPTRYAERGGCASGDPATLRGG
jgi:integrase/recombinase XerD